MSDTCCEPIEYKNDKLRSLQQQLIEAAPAIIFFAVSMFMFTWALGNRELWATEARWAEVVREMFLTGDFFHPTINGEPYFDKPLF
jgi:4-amino-4-deoxy-L-arabinose transferase-like glycosyltransferase